MRTVATFMWAIALVLISVSARPCLAERVRQPVRSLIELRQTNVVIQKWDLSCGAAALATLLQYQYGDPVSEREIARELIKREEYLANPEMVKQRQGFSLLDMKRYLDRRGYKGIGYGKLTLNELIKRAPILIPIEASGYPHFVIFRGVAGNRVLLADPAWGNRTITKPKFDSAWLEYADVGKIGFVVAREDDVAVPHTGLAPQPEEFLMFF